MTSTRVFCKAVLSALACGWLAAFPGPACAADSLTDLMSNALRAYDAGDYGQAFANWNKAADHGNTVAMTAIANMYRQGEGRLRNSSRAAAWYKKAAERGDPVAQLNYGDFLLHGIGVPKNIPMAYVWLRRAANTGNDWARQRYLELERTMTDEQKRRAQAGIDGPGRASNK